MENIFKYISCVQQVYCFMSKQTDYHLECKNEYQTLLIKRHWVPQLLYVHLLFHSLPTQVMK